VPLLTVHLLLTLSNYFVGTPVNTSLMDLGQQLKFLGIEKAGSLLRKLNRSTFRRIVDHQAHYGNGGRREGTAPEMPGLGKCAFLMRSIMMRHSQKQTYRDTSTTLMSLPPKVKCRCCCCCCCDMLTTITSRRLIKTHSALLLILIRLYIDTPYHPCRLLCKRPSRIRYS
jgi:hypothetical protein